MRWTLALSTLSLLAFACTDSPRALLTDLPAAPPADMAVPPTPPDLTPEAISIATVTPNTVSTVGRDQITITGVGFDSRTSFLVGGQSAEVVSVTGTQAVILAPANLGNFGFPVSIQAVRSDGARATNNNGMTSMSRFSYYASTPTFAQIGRYNFNNVNMRAPIVGDFNNDNKNDFIITYISTGQHQVMLNAGGGSFNLVENQLNSPSNLGIQKGMAIDLNGDNFLDWIGADESVTWAYFMGNGQGLFVNGTVGQNSYNNSCSQTNSPTPIKMSSGTTYDVAVACTGSQTVRIWQGGQATGSFFGGQNAAPLGNPNISISTPIHLQVVDVNNDKNSDLVVLSQGNNVPTLTWYNAPAAPPTTLPTTATGNSGAAGTAGANQLNQQPYWFKCVDLNNDNYPDCVVADLNTYTLRVFMNNNGTFVAPTANGVITVGQEPREVNLIDMNGDNKLDILVVNRQFNSFDIIPGRGDGTFGTISSTDGRTLVSRTTTVLQDCRLPWTITAADFDGDGIRDILTNCEQNGGGTTTLGAVLILKNVSR